MARFHLLWLSSIPLCVCVCVCMHISIPIYTHTHTHTLLFSHQVMSDSVNPWTTARQPSPSLTISRSLPKFMSIVSVMPSNHFILCHSLLLPSIFPSIRVFSNESAIHIIDKIVCVCQTLFFWAPKSLQMVTAAMKLKDAYSLEGKL